MAPKNVFFGLFVVLAFVASPVVAAECTITLESGEGVTQALVRSGFPIEKLGAVVDANTIDPADFRRLPVGATYIVPGCGDELTDDEIAASYELMADDLEAVGEMGKIRLIEEVAVNPTVHEKNLTPSALVELETSHAAQQASWDKERAMLSSMLNEASDELKELRKENNQLRAKIAELETQGANALQASSGSSSPANGFVDSIWVLIAVATPGFAFAVILGVKLRRALRRERALSRKMARMKNLEAGQAIVDHQIRIDWGERMWVFTLDSYALEGSEGYVGRYRCPACVERRLLSHNFERHLETAHSGPQLATVRRDIA